ncbi:MAG TPA: hypothetical protein VHA78_00555 [Candidatus Peribacteraceae bacterium]|nr:hypothetical protein [Candidatus Peribacteraceae bacterium]
MSIDFETSAAENNVPSSDIAETLRAALKEGSESIDADVLQRLKRRIYLLREQLQATLVNELGEDDALLDTTYDALFAEAAEFLKPPSEPQSRPFRKSRSNSFKPGYDGGFAKYQ